MKVLRTFGAVMFCAVLGVICVGCDFGKGVSSRSDMTDVIESNYTNVVSVTAVFGSSQSSGTGVLVYEGGYIATNAHVITKTSGQGGFINHEVAKMIHIEFWSEERYDGVRTSASIDAFTITIYPNYNVTAGTDPNDKILYWNINEDLAILHCPNILPDYAAKAAVLRDGAPEKNPLKLGEEIAAMGFSLGEMYRCAVGHITEKYDMFDGNTTENGITVPKNLRYAFMHDAIIIQGNSGGPVFDAWGRCIGLNTMIAYLDTTDDDIDTPGLGFSIALSSRTVLEKIEEVIPGAVI